MGDVREVIQIPVEISLPDIASSQAEQNEAQLVKASQQGDQGAYALLVQSHQRRVFNMVLHMLQDHDDASEITQEAFIAAWQGLPAFRGEARFSTWLYRIAYNCALTQLGQRRREQELHLALQADLESDDSDQKMSQAEQLDNQALVQEQLSQLPPKYRIVLILRHLQDMTYEEMAEVLTMPIGTIKTHLFRARNLLKERLQAFGYERKHRQTRG